MDSVAQLVSLGFDNAAAVQALAVAGGRVEDAAALLLDGAIAQPPGSGGDGGGGGGGGHVSGGINTAALSELAASSQSRQQRLEARVQAFAAEVRNAGGNAALALNTLATLLRNALTKGAEDDKFLRVHYGNAAIAKRTSNAGSLWTVLEAAGFRRTVAGEGHGDVWYQLPQRFDAALLWIALDTVLAATSQG